MLVRDDIFQQLVAYARRRYECISLGTSPDFSKPAQKIRLAFTFDDGWQDNGDIAHPICAEHGIPLTIFVTTDACGLQYPFWPERVTAVCRAEKENPRLSVGFRNLVSTHLAGQDSESTWDSEDIIEALKKLSAEQRATFLRGMDLIATGKGWIMASTLDSTLSWRQIKTLQAAGVSFGSHTQSHQLLPSCDAETIDRELVVSRKTIEEQLAVRCRLLAYPNGSTSKAVESATKEAGYEFAFSVRPGVWTSATDPFCIPRINIWDGKVVNPFGRFSAALFEYAVVWRAYRGAQRTPIS